MTKSSLHFVYFQEISQNPELFVGGASRFDVKQGELGKSNGQCRAKRSLMA